jgi:hypothetical protein
MFWNPSRRQSETNTSSGVSEAWIRTIDALQNRIVGDSRLGCAIHGRLVAFCLGERLTETSAAMLRDVIAIAMR